MSKQPTTPPPSVYTYKSAPDHPLLAPFGITERQLRRWVELRRLEHTKVGLRVFFTEAQIEALAASFTVPAAR